MSEPGTTTRHIVDLVEAAQNVLLDERSPSTEDLLALRGIVGEFEGGEPFLTEDEAISHVCTILRRYVES
jgi:hypothetical protein